MQQLNIVEEKGMRVLTSKQISTAYEVEEWKIKQNFKNNQSRYIEGKHYICLKGEALRAFKNKVENFYLVGKTAKVLYLWTEKGALLHAKSLNTDKAWEVYDHLVDFYFRAKAVQKVVISEPECKPASRQVVDAPVNERIQQQLIEIKKSVAGLEALLDIYSVYRTPENHDKINYAIRQMELNLGVSVMNLTSIQPAIINKEL